MSRDELERAKKMLEQGLDLSRDTVVRLVDAALERWPKRTHLDGCTWWHGGGCSCEPPPERGAPFDEQLEAGHA